MMMTRRVGRRLTGLTQGVNAPCEQPHDPHRRHRHHHTDTHPSLGPQAAGRANDARACPPSCRPPPPRPDQRLPATRSPTTTAVIINDVETGAPAAAPAAAGPPSYPASSTWAAVSSGRHTKDKESAAGPEQHPGNSGKSPPPSPAADAHQTRCVGIRNHGTVPR